MRKSIAPSILNNHMPFAKGEYNTFTPKEQASY